MAWRLMAVKSDVFLTGKPVSPSGVHQFLVSILGQAAARKAIDVWPCKNPYPGGTLWPPLTPPNRHTDRILDPRI